MNKERLIEKLSEANVRAVARLITVIENEDPLSEEIPKWNDMGIEAIFGPGSSTKYIIKYIDGKNIE